MVTIRRYNEAITYYEKALALSTRSLSTYAGLAYTYHLQVFFCYTFSFIFSYKIGEDSLLQISLITGQFHSSYYTLSQGMLLVLSFSILLHLALLFIILEENFTIWSFVYAGFMDKTRRSILYGDADIGPSRWMPTQYEPKSGIN